MHDEPSSHDAELSGLETQLAALVPKAGIDRDRVMYAAGRRAAARRMRVANRLLAGSNVLLGGLLVVVLLPGRTSEPVPAALDAHSVATIEPSDRDVEAARTIVPAGKDASNASLALRDESSNYHLLQLLANDIHAPWERPADAGAPRPVSKKASERFVPRALMHRYLEANGGRM